MVAGGIAESLKAAIDGTKSLSEAFKDMLLTIAINLAKSGIEKRLEKLFLYTFIVVCFKLILLIVDSHKLIYL